jgi:hypothetical protein
MIFIFIFLTIFFIYILSLKQKFTGEQKVRGKKLGGSENLTPQPDKGIV